MKNSIPIFIFLRALGLTEEKIILSINNSNIFENLKDDELEISNKLEKLGKYIPKTLEGTFIMLGELLTDEKHNILRMLSKIKIYIKLFEMFGNLKLFVF
jgi:DNA-directed RNA polymerase beta subunit